MTPRVDRRTFLAALGATAAASMLDVPTVAAADVAPTRVTLPNGLVVLALERRGADTLALQLTARVGSRDDPQDSLGASALTSRLFLQGTTRRPSEPDLQRAAAAVGGSVSRNTSGETCTLSVVVPAKDADLGFDLVSDIVQNARFDADAVARLRTLTAQDLQQRQADPSIIVGDAFPLAMLPGHPLANPVIGTLASIQATTREALLAQRARYWQASNLVLSVVGRIAAAEVVDRARATLGALPAGTRNDRPVVPVRTQPPTTVRVVGGQQQLQFRVGFPAPTVRDPDRAPMTLLSFMHAGPSGTFFRELRTNRGLAYSAGCAYSAFTDAGYWYVFAGVDPDKLSTALGVVRDQLRSITARAPDAAYVPRLVRSYLGGQQVLLETNAAQAARIANEDVLGSASNEEFTRQLRAVTAADLQRVAQRYIDPDGGIVVVVAPKA